VVGFRNTEAAKKQRVHPWAYPSSGRRKRGVGGGWSVLPLLLDVCGVVVEAVPELERGELRVWRGGGSRGRAEEEGDVGSGVQRSGEPLELVAGDVRIGLKGPPAAGSHKTRGHGEVEVVVPGGRQRVDGGGGHEVVLQEREVRHLRGGGRGDGDGAGRLAGEVLLLLLRGGHAEVGRGGGEGVRRRLREADVVGGGGGDGHPERRRLLLLVLGGRHPREQLGEGRRGGGGGGGAALPRALPGLDAALGAGEREDGAFTGLRRAAAARSRELVVVPRVLLRIGWRVLVVGSGGGKGGGRVGGEPGGGVEGRELVDGVGGGLDEPVDGLAGLVAPEAVLQVVELDGGGDGEAHAAVADALGRVHLAVAVLAPRRAGHAVDPRRGVLVRRPRHQRGRRAPLGARLLLLVAPRALHPPALPPVSAARLHPDADQAAVPTIPRPPPPPRPALSPGKLAGWVSEKWSGAPRSAVRRQIWRAG
jgi:hypothetical protein